MFLRIFKWQSMNRQLLLTLAVGLTCGFTMAYLFLKTSDSDLYVLMDPHSSHDISMLRGPTEDPGVHEADEEFHKMEDRTVADKMYEKVRILCWIMTGPQNHERKARHVKNTWGKRCNKLLFMSTREDKSLPSIPLPVKENRENLWGKTKEAFKYIYKHHFNEADWFLKADDDTYTILENLRYMLMPHNSSEPIYYGCRFKPYVKQGYMSGGAGYVLSKEAVRRFVEIAVDNKTLCKESDTGAEDVEMGKCLEAVHVKAGDSRDSLGRGRFFPFVPEHHLIPGHTRKDFWYWQYVFYEAKEGMECCSDNAVSFHYISPNQMYVLEYLIYHLRPYGISFNVKMPPELADGNEKSVISTNSTSRKSKIER